MRVREGTGNIGNVLHRIAYHWLRVLQHIETFDATAYSVEV